MQTLTKRKLAYIFMSQEVHTLRQNINKDRVFKIIHQNEIKILFLCIPNNIDI